MKLYTEEELRKHLYNHDEKFFEKLTSIELPSDEEIEDLIGDGMHDYYKAGFQEGAKWMRDKITMTQQTYGEWMRSNPPIPQQTDHVPDVRKKVTAVEWLIEQRNKYGNIILNDLEQAKAMEKEQITKAWDDGDYAYFYSKETGKDFENGEEYYNEKYGG